MPYTVDYNTKVFAQVFQPTNFHTDWCITLIVFNSFALETVTFWLLGGKKVQISHEIRLVMFLSEEL